MALPRLITDNERIDVPCDLQSFRGKPVIVYCWASWDGRHASDMSERQAVLDQHAKLGLELLCVNLDKTPQEARGCLPSSSAPGVHVFQRGGLDGIWATRYGILTLPTIIVVGRDGMVVAPNLPLGQLKDEIPRLLK